MLKPIGGEITSQDLNDNFSFLDSEKINKGDMGFYNFGLFGADKTGIGDSTAIFNALVAQVPEGSRITFPSGIYKGNFVSSKSLTLDFQDSVLISAKDTEPVVGFRATENPPIAVTDVPILYGRRTFTVAGASGLKAGDIGYLYDGSVRPSDNTPKINVEMLKISKVEGNTVTVHDMIRSDMNTGSVYFVKINAIKNPRVLNANIKPTNTHYDNGILFFGCEEPFTQSIKVEGFSRHGLRHEYCYNALSIGASFKDPRLVGSGQGYGLTFKGCRIGYGMNIYAENCRHAIDMSTSYFCKAEKVDVPSSAGLPVYLSHNGYGGFNEIEDATLVNDSGAIHLSKQGIADETKHTTRGYRVKKIRHVVPTAAPSDTMYSCYFQTDYADIEVDDYQVTYINTSGDLGMSRAIRFGGDQKGPVSVRNVRANVITVLVFAERRSSSNMDKHIFKVDQLTADKCSRLLYARGMINVSVGSYKCKEQFGTDGLISVIPWAGADVFRLSFDSADIEFNTKNFTLTPPASGFRGKQPSGNEGVGSSLTITNGGTIDAEKCLTSGDYLRIDSGVGTGTVTLNTSTPIEAPMWVGQKLVLYVLSGRNNVVIPVGGTVVGPSNITIPANTAVQLVGYAGKWFAA